MKRMNRLWVESLITIKCSQISPRLPLWCKKTREDVPYCNTTEKLVLDVLLEREGRTVELGFNFRSKLCSIVFSGERYLYNGLSILSFDVVNGRLKLSCPHCYSLENKLFLGPANWRCGKCLKVSSLLESQRSYVGWCVLKRIKEGDEGLLLRLLKSRNRYAREKGLMAMNLLGYTDNGLTLRLPDKGILYSKGWSVVIKEPAS